MTVCNFLLFGRLRIVKHNTMSFLLKRLESIVFSRFLSTTTQVANFGLLFDIDGVLVRSNRVLPSVKETFSRLVDSKGKFRVPTVFVTNGGNKLRHQKASQLTNWLGVEINEHQVVMAYSPLSLFKNYHHKRAIISGQGPVIDIARELGFRNVTTMEKLIRTFPHLDAVDHERYRPAQCDFSNHFKPIEVVVMFGEPVRWESSLQLLLDLLVTNGIPTGPPSEINYPHIPIIACNMDLLWMAEAKMPRFGHGAFLVCLENLYQKLTKRDLIYTAIVGKPSEITYHYAHRLIMRQAKEIGTDKITTLYAIGDNVNTDIFGANLYNKYLANNPLDNTKEFPRVSCSIDTILEDNDDLKQGAKACASVLVETGVSSPEQHDFINHTPRDFLPAEEQFFKPTYVAKDASNAVDIIFYKQKYK